MLRRIVDREPSSRTGERLAQVKEGMSREEVIRTVGSPPLDKSHSLMPYVDQDEWSCADGWLLVHFGDDRTAQQVRVMKNSQPTLTERIRRWLGL
jgi:hypothetical protein